MSGSLCKIPPTEDLKELYTKYGRFSARCRKSGLCVGEKNKYRVVVPNLADNKRSPKKDGVSTAIRYEVYPPRDVTFYSLEEAVGILGFRCEVWVSSGVWPAATLEPWADPVPRKLKLAAEAPPEKLGADSFTLREYAEDILTDIATRRGHGSLSAYLDFSWKRACDQNLLESDAVYWLCSLFWRTGTNYSEDALDDFD